MIARNHVARVVKAQRGAAMMVALALVLAITLVIAGTQMVVVQQLESSKSERDYERALMMAEAGMNSYVNMLSNGAGTGTNAAYVPSIYSFTTSTLGAAPTLSQFRTGIENSTYALTQYPSGSQQGYFVGQVAGANTGDYIITSYGWSNGVSRMVSVTNTELGNYALFSAGSVSMGGSNLINGNLGTDGSLTLSGNAQVNGNVTTGAGSKNAIKKTKNISGTVSQFTTDPVWPTVETIAADDFPGPPSGLSYLATHNDNALVPAISSAGVLSGSSNVTFVGKSGGANYYLTSISLGGSNTISFDNTLGPITVWLGPSGGTGSVTINGNNTFIPQTSDPSKAVRIYSALNSTIYVSGSNTFYVGIYNINNGGTAQVETTGNGSINMAVVTNQFVGGGNGSINYIRGLFNAPGSSLTSSGWTELQ